jgi:hypothetical protein
MTRIFLPISLLSGGSGEALTRPNANIALPPRYLLRQRVQDQISRAATIRENPQIRWWGDSWSLCSSRVLSICRPASRESFYRAVCVDEISGSFAREKQLLVGARRSLLRYFDDHNRKRNSSPSETARQEFHPQTSEEGGRDDP